MALQPTLNFFLPELLSLRVRDNTVLTGSKVFPDKVLLSVGRIVTLAPVAFSSQVLGSVVSNSFSWFLVYS